MKALVFLILVALAFNASAELARKNRPKPPKHFRVVSIR
jgi:hypothetical protein